MHKDSQITHKGKVRLNIDVYITIINKSCSTKKIYIINKNDFRKLKKKKRKRKKKYARIRKLKHISMYCL